MGQGVRTGLGHGGITCVLLTQFSSLNYFLLLIRIESEMLTVASLNANQKSVLAKRIKWKLKVILICIKRGRIAPQKQKKKKKKKEKV